MWMLVPTTIDCRRVPIGVLTSCHLGNVHDFEVPMFTTWSCHLYDSEPETYLRPVYRYVLFCVSSPLKISTLSLTRCDFAAGVPILNTPAKTTLLTRHVKSLASMLCRQTNQIHTCVRKCGIGWTYQPGNRKSTSIFLAQVDQGPLV